MNTQIPAIGTRAFVPQLGAFGTIIDNTRANYYGPRVTIQLDGGHTIETSLRAITTRGRGDAANDTKETNE